MGGAILTGWPPSWALAHVYIQDGVVHIVSSFSFSKYASKVLNETGDEPGNRNNDFGVRINGM